jgi:hypothetical protein
MFNIDTVICQVKVRWLEYLIYAGSITDIEITYFIDIAKN